MLKVTEPVYTEDFDQLFESEFINVFPHEEFYHLFTKNELHRIKQVVKPTVFAHSSYRGTLLEVNWRNVRKALTQKEKVIVSTVAYDITRYVGLDTLGIPVYYSGLFEGLRESNYGVIVVGLSDSGERLLGEALKEIRLLS